EEADIEIIKYLAHAGKLFHKEKYEHSYPHCWRCKTPLLNYATSSWFIQSPKIKKQLLEENKKISWVPDHIGTKRFHNWLESTRDWAVSRSRYWGAPLPVWENKETGDYTIIGSLKELKEKTRSTNNFFLVRHGQSEANVSDNISCTIGQFGDKLTADGKQNVKKTAESVSENIDVIISSPFERTKQTSEIIAEIIGFEKEDIIFNERIGERNFGTSNNKSNSKFNSWLNSEDFNFYNKYEGGESHFDVKKRMMDFIYEINEKYDGKNILIVSHNDPLRFLQIGSLGLENDKALEFLEKGDCPNSELVELNFSIIPKNEEYVLDFHRPFIDEICWTENGKKYEFIKEVFDCWFESGSMPFASKHYPFENKDIFNPEKNIGFPADFIAEGQDQTRGWFNTLLILSTALFGKSAFKNVIVNGVVLAEDGKKMSKSLKNYPDVNYILHKYGADALRLYLSSSPVVRGESLAFSEKGVDEILKKVILKSKNVLAFYNLYKDELKIYRNPKDSRNILDQWILARTNKLVVDVTESLEKYELDVASRPFADYVDDLSTWYIRRSRDRFKGDDEEDKDFAISTTKEVLMIFAKTIAPFAPFLAEELYFQLKEESNLESVHLENWSESQESFIDKILRKNNILDLMDELREIVSNGLEMRVVAGIRVRQPLASVLVLSDEVAVKTIFKNPALLEIIKDELNIKNIFLSESKQSALDDSKLVKEFKQLQEIQNEINGLFILLNKNIDKELQREGDFREFLRLVQSMRKNQGLNVKDWIELKIDLDEGDREFVEFYKEELKKVAGVKNIYYSELEEEESLKINNINLKVFIVKL
ncbi:MAG: class I tRNA ligase family protein, partial [Candidatus Pacebacteria bacterium]|nr:class I tRNA ligase family protein [Candidatus Paceibacterota bacterium]